MSVIGALLTLLSEVLRLIRSENGDMRRAAIRIRRVTDTINLVRDALTEKEAQDAAEAVSRVLSGDDNSSP